MTIQYAATCEQTISDCPVFEEEEEEEEEGSATDGITIENEIPLDYSIFTEDEDEALTAYVSRPSINSCNMALLY